MIALWLRGKLVAQWPRFIAAALGIAAAAALVGLVGTYAISSSATMTARALSATPVDWQIALVPGADVKALSDMLPAGAPVTARATVGYADAASLSSTVGGATQVTGTGQILGLPGDYATLFPGQLRPLVGTRQGVLLAQQTASNLHATVGSLVTVTPTGAPAFQVTVAGIVDLPNADALFQLIGPQKGLAPTAPPDNVVILPLDQWQAHFAQAVQMPGGGARLQLHARLDRARLPSAPDVAYMAATGMARNFEVRAAGAAMIGDNLAARLDAVRQDAIFARVLLLFLGLPGAALALALVTTLVQADGQRRRRENALLGLRGARTSQIGAILGVEAVALALVGSSLGVVGAAALARGFLNVDLHAHGVALWFAGTWLGIFVLACAAVITPALGDMRAASIAIRRAWLRSATLPVWARGYLDVILLAISAAIYWRSAAGGYQLVLAPEGVAATAVDYTAFLAPLCFWIGAALLTLRLARWSLYRGRGAVTWLVAPFAGRLAPFVSASLLRQRGRLAAGAALVAVAVSFAVATSVFNATYDAQQRVDALLTNGADVTVTGSAPRPAGAELARIRSVPGVVEAQPMQHRFAYVGKDLQDLYGVDPHRIGSATDLVDGYFSRLTAAEAMSRLAHQTDGILVSQETVNDFQLAIGDMLNLRLRAADGALKTVPFHLVGVVKEFPTAPRDSFLVANASYVAAQTGKPEAEVVLARVTGDPATIATRVEAALTRGGNASANLKVSNVDTVAHLIGSSLTAMDMRGIGRVEIAFAVLFAAMAASLTLWLGRADRARTDAILLSLGAGPGETRGFMWGEALAIVGFGVPLGLVIGVVDAWMLVRLLSGVFDPPPDALVWPWSTLIVTLMATLGAILLSIMAQSVWSKDWAAREMRAAA